MRHFPMAVAVRVSALVLSLVWLPVVYGVEPSKAGAYDGPQVAVGSGYARAFVVLDEAGEASAIGVKLSAETLQGLPPQPPGDGPAWEYRLALPKEAANIGYDHVTVDWNPHGHMPAGVYDAAHFDFHFYLINVQERERITLEGGDLARASRIPAPEFMPPGYVLPPDTAEPRMGAHAIDPGGLEFNSEPFSHTFIYGFYDGKMVFLEPMVSKAFLDAREEVSKAITIPERVQHTAYYPSRYRISFDPAGNEHLVVLEGLAKHEGP